MSDEKKWDETVKNMGVKLTESLSGQFGQQISEGIRVSMEKAARPQTPLFPQTPTVLAIREQLELALKHSQEFHNKAIALIIFQDWIETIIKELN